MTTRRGQSTDGASEVPSAGASTQGENSLYNRYPIVAFSYDRDASRLVMLYRDPATGETLSQIPTEVALKQYEEALRKQEQGAKSESGAPAVSDRLAFSASVESKRPPVITFAANGQPSGGSGDTPNGAALNVFV